MIIYFFLSTFIFTVFSVCEAKLSYIEEYREHLQKKLLNKNWEDKENEILEEINKTIEIRPKDDNVESDLKFGSFRCFYCPDTYSKTGELKELCLKM